MERKKITTFFGATMAFALLLLVYSCMNEIIPVIAADPSGANKQTDAQSTLAAPTSLTATATSSTVIKLIWIDNSTAETGFKIERSADKITWSVVGSVEADVKVYENTGLTPGTKYYYRVRAFNATVFSEYSNLTDPSTPAANVALGAPTNLVATINSSTVIKLTWNDNSTSETGFKIERSADKITWAVVGSVDANVKVFENSGLTPATKYYYRVRAYNATAFSEYSNLTDPSTPAANATMAAPTNLAATGNSATVIRLTWNDNSEAETGYRIERSTDNANWTSVGTVGANVKVFENSGLTPATKYYYRVKAVGANAESTWSNVSYAVTLAATLAAPSNLVATVNSSTVIKLTWNDNSTSETGFKIERSADKITWSVVGSVEANVKVYENTGLTPGTKYYYRVRAFNATAFSEYSNLTDPSTPVANATLAAPTNLAVTSGTSTSVRMTWTDNSEGETGFLIEKSLENGTWTQVGIVGANVKVFELGGLTGGTKYLFRVRAYTNNAYSAYSSIAWVVTL